MTKVLGKMPPIKKEQGKKKTQTQNQHCTEKSLLKHHPLKSMEPHPKECKQQRV